MTLRCELLLVLTVGFQWIPAGLSLVLAVPGWFSAGSRRGSFPTVTGWFAVRLCSASALWMVSLSVRRGFATGMTLVLAWFSVGSRLAGGWFAVGFDLDRGQLPTGVQQF